jgi:succinylglutamic semialdehyde dehydrogenase
MSITYRGNFIQGEFRLPSDANGEWSVKSPADLTDTVATLRYSYRSVDEATHSARSAFATWKKTSFAERAELLKKYKDRLKAREEDLARIMVREVGKPLWEAKQEVATMLNKVDITLNESMQLVADRVLPKIMEGTTGTWKYRPLGVMAVIGPFNFPGHLANGHIVPALATGNTVIFKPSEKSPMTGQIMAECFQEAGFPAGVFNLLQGERETSRRLCVHEEIDAILFTGSYEVGMRIKQDTLSQHWKLLALEMGGKNPAIVWEPQSLDYAIHETLCAAFLTAGQRCSATSRVLVQRKHYGEFVKRFHERAKAFKIGHPLEDVFMGPVIDSQSVDRFLKFIGIAGREGFEIVMRGKTLEIGKPGYYVTPTVCAADRQSLDAARKGVYTQTELFAPNISIVGVDDLEEAIALANVTEYGLVASIFTSQEEVFRRAYDDLEFGLVNWNKMSVGASSKLPFGGFKKSGNHWPTAVTSTLYCTAPVASLEVSEPKAQGPFSNYPGLNWS